MNALTKFIISNSYDKSRRYFASDYNGVSILLWSWGNHTFPVVTYCGFKDAKICKINREKVNHIFAIFNSYGIKEIKVYYPQRNFTSIDILKAGDTFSQKYSVQNAAHLFNSLLGIPLKNYGQSTKSKNKPDAVQDNFHNWSRDTFSSNIIKQDLDGVLLSSDGGTISCFIEIKQSPSKKIPEGKWQPYENDRANYYQLFDLTRHLNTVFYTIHSDVQSTGILTANSLLEIFTYDCKQGNLSFEEFRSRNNCKILSASDFLKKLFDLE